MRVLIRRVLITVIVLAGLVYAGDYVSLQLQIPNHRTQFGTVMVERDYAVPLKNRSTEYMFDKPVPVTCVYSLFPHFGDPPCWYLSRHSRQEIKMGCILLPESPFYDRIGAMTVLVFGTNLAQDWNVAGLQLIYCFLYYSLLKRRRDFNLLSLDAWLPRK